MRRSWEGAPRPSPDDSWGLCGWGRVEHLQYVRRALTNARPHTGSSYWKPCGAGRVTEQGWPLAWPGGRGACYGHRKADDPGDDEPTEGRVEHEDGVPGGESSASSDDRREEVHEREEGECDVGSEWGVGVVELLVGGSEDGSSDEGERDADDCGTHWMLEGAAFGLAVFAVVVGGDHWKAPSW